MPRVVLLNPGPVNVTPKVREALLREDLCHREKEFADLLHSIRGQLVNVFGIEQDYTAVLISGSGTAALEMAVSSCLSEGRSLLVIRNGVYGERIANMADAYRLPSVTVDAPWGEPPRLEDIERALHDHPEIEVVAAVHHETTTGLLNPLQEIANLVQAHKKKFLVDAISSLAGDPLDFERTAIDLCVGTANKCLQGLPGVSFVLMKKSDVRRLEKIPARNLYFNLVNHYRAQEKGDTLFTPAVQIHYALDAALDELAEETVAGRIQRYRDAAQRLRRGFRAMGLEFLIPEAYHSNTLTALKLPEGMPYGHLHDQLKDRGFVIYAGQGGLGPAIFRVANMGDIRPEEFERFLESLKDCLASSRKTRD